MNDNQEKNEELLKNYLSAEELLAANSLRARVSNEIELTSKVLPKTGFKLFEPNGSWLQNRQIDACLEARRDLIGVERVKRISKLAVGEWLPHEKRIKVTKRSGIDWTNFGCELRGTLYLNPEEALLQVELNCLDLFFNGVSLSVQQAYELLINSPNSDCTLEEYRVYSQLARMGYRLKRFYYYNSSYDKSDESSQPKKKVIIDPENSQWMSGVSLATDTSDKNTKKDAEFVINRIIDQIEVEEQILIDKCAENTLSKIENDMRSNDKSKPRLNIVSVETMVDPVKLVATNRVENKTKESNTSSIGIRIQRNVKLLPKRTDRITSSSLSSSSLPSYINTNFDSSVRIISDQFNNSNNGGEKCTVEKRKFDDIESSSSLASTSSVSLEPLKEITLTPVKKFRNERTELSDDEIQEIPIKMTKVEMLNCLPNLKDKNSIKVTVNPKYIPNDIKLTRNTHEYDRSCSNDIKYNYYRSNKSVDRYQRDGPSSSLFTSNKSWQYNSNYSNNYQRSHYQSGFIANRELRAYNDIMFDNSSHYRTDYCSMVNSNQQSVSNRWSSLHVNFFKNIAMATFSLRTSITQSISNIYSSSFNTQQFFGRNNSHAFNPSRNFNYLPIQNNSNQTKNNNNDNSSSNAIQNLLNDSDFENYCSFKKIPANSWSELKKMWKEAKTITIEDDNDQMDCSEVEIVDHTIQPLVGPKYSSSLKQIYDRLKIIKPAQEKLVRKKKGHYKISYKVYSNTQFYRKACPGQAMFHLVVTSQKNSDNLLQPIDLNRLYQDGDGIAIVFAYVSGTTINFMQAGIVSLPNLVE